MSFIDRLTKKIESYNIQDLRVIYIKEVEKIENFDGIKIARYTPNYQIMIAKMLINQSSNKFKRYNIVSHGKTIEEMPAEYCNKGDNVVVQSFPLEHYLKHKVGVKPTQNRYSVEQISQMEQLFDTKYNESKMSSVSKNNRA